MGPGRDDHTAGGRARELGGCVLHEQVGSGASGAVYRAVQKSLGREVAVKVLRARDPQAIERFRREAEVTSRLNSRNIAHIIDFGTTPEGESYFILELLHGEDLGARLERVGKLGLEAALGITEQVARALRLAHDNQVVHRDLKPQNIFLHQTPDDGEIVKVIDFGVSRVLGVQRGAGGDGRARAPATPARGGELVGSPLYMAPEQVEQRTSQIDERSDVYALGVVVFEMLTGRTPFASAGHLLELMLLIAGPEPAPLACDVEPGVSHAVAAVIARALAKRREERYGSVTAFFNELRHAARSAAPATGGPRPTAALVGTQRLGTTYLSGKLVAPLWRRRRIPDELRFAVPEGGFEDGVPGARSLELAAGRSEWFIGRHPACELVLPHSRVSRRSVRVTLRAGRAQLCRLRECTVPVRVGPTSLAAGEERALHHGESVTIGAVSGVFLDGRYVQPQVSPLDIDVETGLLGRDGLAWELALALRMDERARLFVVMAMPDAPGANGPPSGAATERAVRIALALHAESPERPIARIDGVTAALCAADEPLEPLLAATERALAPPSSDSGGGALGRQLLAGSYAVSGPSDESAARIDEATSALERLAASGVRATGAGLVDLTDHLRRPLVAPGEFEAVARARLAAGGAVTLFAMEGAAALARLGPGVCDALERELAELVTRVCGVKSELCRVAQGALAAATDGASDVRAVARAWRDRGPVRVEPREVERIVRVAACDAGALAELALIGQALAGPAGLAGGALAGSAALAGTALAGGDTPAVRRVRAAVIETLPQPLAHAAHELWFGAERAPALALRVAAFLRAACAFTGAALAGVGLRSAKSSVPHARANHWADAIVPLCRAIVEPSARIEALARAFVAAGALRPELAPGAALARGTGAAELGTGAPPPPAAAAWLEALGVFRGWALVCALRSDRSDWERDAHRVRYLDFTGPGAPLERVASLPAPLLAEAGVYLTRLSEGLVVPLDPWLVAAECAECGRHALFVAQALETEPGAWAYACAACGAERQLAVASERVPDSLVTGPAGVTGPPATHATGRSGGAA